MVLCFQGIMARWTRGWYVRQKNERIYNDIESEGRMH